MMNIEKFLKIEKKYNLYEKSIDGVQYWNYVRFSLWNYKICSLQLNMEKSYKKKQDSIISKIKPIFSMLYCSVFKSRIPQKNVDILFLNHSRRVMSQSYYECPYTERLSEKYDNSVTLEMSYMRRHFHPVKTHNLMYADYISIIGGLFYRFNKYILSGKYKKLYRLVEEQICQPVQEIKEAYSCKIADCEIYDRILEEILLHKAEYREYKKLIKKINPQIIIEVVYYNRQNMMINEIAKEMGITVVELQHGTMHPEHAAYHYAKGAKIRQFADRMFLFSDFWKQTIQVPIREEYLISTGYPFFENNVKQYKTIQKTNGKKTVLFVSQWTIGANLSRLAVGVSRMLSEDEYHIIYKLHPSEYPIWREKYPWLKSAKIEVIDHNRESIYKYFAVSDFQIGVYSTAIYEGLGFGLPTFIYRTGHYDSMERLVSEGYAQYVDRAEDIVDCMISYACEHKRGLCFWKKNALQNMENEIDKLIYEKKNI